jgi:thiaminase
VASASPVTQAFGDFMVRTGLEGGFEDIVTVLYVTEGTYLDWGTRLLEAGKRPSHPVYREWIDIHGPQVLGAFVAWLSQHLDSADLGSQGPRIDRIFHTALRYEYLFWEAAYHGSAHWPDQNVG